MKFLFLTIKKNISLVGVDVKIGIFGDSYGYYDDRFTTQSWVKYISQDFDVTTYCENGSSTYLIYQNFLKYQQLYDVVIVLVTFPIRLHTSIIPLPSGEIAKFWIKVCRNNLTYTEKQILTATGNFIDVVQLDDELFAQFTLYHNILIEKIKSIRENILFIPCFSVPNTEFNDTSLYDISVMEESAWGEHWETVLKRNARPHDERQSHMCNENNFILYTQIKNMISSIKGHVTFKVDISKFAKPDNLSTYIPKKYYE